MRAALVLVACGLLVAAETATAADGRPSRGPERLWKAFPLEPEPAAGQAPTLRTGVPRGEPRRAAPPAPGAGAPRGEPRRAAPPAPAATSSSDGGLPTPLYLLLLALVLPAAAMWQHTRRPAQRRNTIRYRE
jgi:hypothetical protein